MDDQTLKGKLALITGASGGIGSATAQLLASLGCDLALHYHSSPIDPICDSIRQKHPQVSINTFKADLTSYDQTRAMHADLVESVGHPHIIFLNAGLNGSLSGVKKIEDVSIEAFELTWRGNCGSAFLLAQLCIAAMEQKGWGRVIFCSSVAGFTGGVVGPHYASSKSALHGLIHWLSAAYCKSGITVNGVAPALIQNTNLLPTSSADLAAKIPMNRLGHPTEVAETVAWLCKVAYVTYKVVGVDGGMWVQ